MTQAAPKTTPFTLGELMVAAAAREIRDGDVCFVGMRLPLIAFVVAKRTHAPNAIGLFENGVIRATPAPELIYTMADPPNILGATQCLDMLGVMSLLQSGRVNLGFLGAAEIDRFGNLNSTRVVTAESRHATANRLPANDQRPKTSHAFVRLPGSGGACDIASLAQRFVCLLEHAKHRLPERVAFLTSPGNGDGGNWRARVGLPRGGPAACITTKCVIRFCSAADRNWSAAPSSVQAASAHPSKGRGSTRGDNAPSQGYGFSRADTPPEKDRALAPAVTVVPGLGEAYLETLHPGVTLDDVLANTGWKLRVSPNLSETPAPTAEELAAIRDYDQEGFWTGR